MDIDPSSLTAKAQAFAQLDTVLKNISDKLEKIDTSDTNLISKGFAISKGSANKDTQKNKRGIDLMNLIMYQKNRRPILMLLINLM